MNSLYQQLIQYCKSDFYPFHMPGHKRNSFSIKDTYQMPYSFDITEIDGFDNLHHAEGILLEAQRQAAELYQAEETLFLVNGSTAGLLSAISACVSKNGKLLMARNCHKAVYHGVFLKELENVYIYPQKEQRYGGNGGLLIENIKQMLITCKNCEAILVTSPTYEGIVSNIEEICNVAHDYGIPVIVDEAHGAHFGFHSYFPESSIKNGADIVIHSVHKTLPSLTQTALLHINGKLVDREKIKKYLSIYQSSSPSYVLMASIDACMTNLKKQGDELFSRYVERLNHLREQMKSLNHIQLVDEDIIGTSGIINIDRSKLFLSVKEANITGKELYDILCEQYHLQFEMASSEYIIGMTSIMDTQRGYDRLVAALREIDSSLQRNGGKVKESYNKPYVKVVQKCSISKAEESEKISIPLEQSKGWVSGEYVSLYPPGIPLLAPGEMISEELLQQIMFYKKNNLCIEGLSDYSGKNIQVLKKE